MRHFEGTPLAIAAGTFDPADFAAYLLGLLGAVAVDTRLLTGRRVPVGTGPT